jgi:hypothetical protein
MLGTRIKRISGGSLGEDSNGGFSYIISSWLIEEWQERTTVTLCIMTFYLTSLNKICGRCFWGYLLQYFVSIMILRCFGGAC